jgi:hypothetical protein
MTRPRKMGSSEGMEGSGEGCRKKRLVFGASSIVGAEGRKLASISGRGDADGELGRIAANSDDYAYIRGAMWRMAELTR